MNFRQFFQYRLRTFLIMAFAVAFGSSWIGVNYAEFEREQLAIQRINKQVLSARGRFYIVRVPNTVALRFL